MRIYKKIQSYSLKYSETKANFIKNYQLSILNFSLKITSIINVSICY